MRYGSRHARQKLRWLTLFLTKLFSETDLARMAEESRRMAGVWRPDWCEAVQQAHIEVLMAREHLEDAGSKPISPPIEAGLRAPEENSALAHAIELTKRALSHSEGGRHEEAVTAYDELLARFGASPAPLLMGLAAWVLLSKGVALHEMGRSDEAIAAYDEVLMRFGASAAPELIEQVARALFNKGVTLGDLGRSDEAITAYDDLLERLGAATKPELMEQVARALVNKGVVLGELGRCGEELNAYDDLLRRFGASTALELKAPVVRALENRGRLLSDGFGRFAEAEESYRRATALDLEDEFVQANLAWLLLETGRLDEAQALIADLGTLDPAGRALLAAGHEFASDNFGLGVTHLATALDLELREGFSPFFEDLLRLLRLVAARGFGERLLAWLEESGAADRYAPIYGAFVAKVRGERFLRDLNPEVRQVAEKLFKFLSRPKTEEQAGKTPRSTKRGRKKS